jgi:hypothetical protein
MPTDTIGGTPLRWPSSERQKLHDWSKNSLCSGYVLDFSNPTFSEFFEDEFTINIYQDKYAVRGSSKANHLRAFIEAEDGFLTRALCRTR